MGKDLHVVPESTLRVRGNFLVENLDTNTGKLSAVSADRIDFLDESVWERDIV
jgi:hypothetical protein